MKGTLYIQVMLHQDCKHESSANMSRALCKSFALNMTQYLGTNYVSGNVEAVNYRHDFHSGKHSANRLFPWTICPILE